MSSLTKSLLKTLTDNIYSPYVSYIFWKCVLRVVKNTSTYTAKKKNESKFNVSEDIFIFIRHLSNLYCINYNVACAFLSLHKLNEHQVSGKSHDEKVVYTRFKCLSIFNTQTCVCVCVNMKRKTMTTMECYLFTFSSFVIFNIMMKEFMYLLIHILSHITYYHGSCASSTWSPTLYQSFKSIKCRNFSVFRSK